MVMERIMKAKKHNPMMVMMPSYAFFSTDSIFSDRSCVNVDTSVPPCGRRRFNRLPFFEVWRIVVALLGRRSVIGERFVDFKTDPTHKTNACRKEHNTNNGCDDFAHF